MGSVAQGDIEHLLGRRHLQVERTGQLGLQAPDVAVGDVPPVLAQVRGDAVGAALQRKVRGAQGIGMASTARVTDGGHVIDIHAQAQMGKRARLTHAGTDPD